MLAKEFPYDERNGLLTAIGFEERAKETSEEFKARDADAKKLGFESGRELEEAIELLRAKREGRIVEVPEENLGGTEKNTSGAKSRTNGSRESQGEEEEASPPTTPQDGDTDKSPVLRRITNRIRRPKSPSTSRDTDVEQSEHSEDNDDFTPAPVDYSQRIARAEERNATEIAKLEREQELVSKADSLPPYSYGWFLALLELECMATSEKNADGKTISIRFGKVEKDLVSPRTIILNEPNRFIPASVEELSSVCLSPRNSTSIPQRCL